MPSFASFSRNRNSNAVSGISVDSLQTLSVQSVTIVAKISSKPGTVHTYEFVQTEGTPVEYTQDQLTLSLRTINEEVAKFKLIVDKDTRDQRSKDFVVSTLPTDSLTSIASGVSALVLNDVPERLLTNISFEPVYPSGVRETTGYTSEYTLVFGTPEGDKSFFTHTDLYKKSGTVFEKLGSFYDQVNQYQPIGPNQLLKFVSWFDFGGNLLQYESSVKTPARVSALMDSKLSPNCLSELDYVSNPDLGMIRLRPNDYASLFSGLSETTIAQYDVGIVRSVLLDSATFASCGCSELSVVVS